MKWFIVLLFLFIVPIVFAQTPEIVMTPADVEIRFSGESDWINGADATQAIFTVGPVSYSTEALSIDVKHTTKLDAPETWEVEMWHLPGEPFNKSIFVITIYQATHRIYELRTRNRYAGEDTSGPWSLLTEDKVIGKPGKAVNIK